MYVVQFELKTYRIITFITTVPLVPKTLVQELYFAI